jgi:transmembrane sensor
MPAEEDYFDNLLRGYANNTISEKEIEELFNYLNNAKEKPTHWLKEFDEIFRQRLLNPPVLPQAISQKMKAAVLKEINSSTITRLPTRFNLVPLLKIAAVAILLIICSGAYLLVYHTAPKNSKTIVLNLQHSQRDALPGFDGAVLTTAGGSQIILDSAGNGVITSEHNTHVLKRGNQLVYEEAAQKSDEQQSFNTLSTQKGRKFELVLADGTKVWLDAASSITYPMRFSAQERRVKASGQLYFEVAKDSSKPFVVEAAGTTVEVLGTHFNLNAYEDEASTKTTLLEGAVKVSKVNQRLLLKPGQQAVSDGSANGVMQLNNNVDINAVMAWKTGLFQFSNADLSTVLRHLARWYDMEIVYEGKIPDRKFEGKIGRDLNLSQVLKVLEIVQVKFRIEGKKLIVQE